MKKIILALALLCLAISTAYANQCPPSSALSHPKQGGHWKLNDTYKKQGWYVSNYPWIDTVYLNSLLKDSAVEVHLVSNEDIDPPSTPNWFVTCKYLDKTSAFPRFVVVTNNQLLKMDPAKNPVPNFYPSSSEQQSFVSDYTCQTTTENMAQCTW